MKTGKPVFKTFDMQLDKWMEQTRRTPDKKGLDELVQMFDKEFGSIFGNSISGKFASRSTAWLMASEAGSMARNGDFVPAS